MAGWWRLHGSSMQNCSLAMIRGRAKLQRNSTRIPSMKGTLTPDQIADLGFLGRLCNELGADLVISGN